MTPPRCFGLAGALVLAIVATGCSSGGPVAIKSVDAASSPPLALVKAAPAITRAMPVEVKTIGKVEPTNTIQVRAQVGGTLVKAHFREGDMVRHGDVLFEIDPRPYQLAIRQWEAAIARAQAQTKQSQAELERAQAQQQHAMKQQQRYEQLATEGIFSREQSEQMALEARTRQSGVQLETAAIEGAQAALAAAEASLATAKLNLSYCTIRSPITGRTGSLRVHPGNLVRANDMELVTIHQVSPTDVSFSVPEDKLLQLRERVTRGSLPVTAAIPGDTQPAASGRIHFLESAVDAATGTIRLKANFSNTDARLWPGQFVNVRVVMDQRPNAVVVPPSALQTGQAGNFVYVIKPDDTIELRLVRAGPRDETGISIEQGLAAGERVVVEGHLRVAPGVKVRVAS